MFVIERDPKRLGSGRTIDRERGMELTEIMTTRDEIRLVLNVKGKDITVSASYRFAGENRNIIEYFVERFGNGWSSARESYSKYDFSSRAEKLEIAKYIEEALKAFGVHHSLPPGHSVDVKFSKEALSYRERGL